MEISQIEFRETIKQFYNIELDMQIIQNEIDKDWINMMSSEIFAIEIPSLGVSELWIN